MMYGPCPTYVWTIFSWFLAAIFVRFDAFIVFVLSTFCLNDVGMMCEWHLNDIWMLSQWCLNHVWMMSERCLHIVSIIFLGHFDALVVFLFKFMAGAWVLYLDAVHHSVYFHWFCFCFLSYQESLHAKFVFLAYSFFLSFLLAFFAAVMGEEQWFFTYGSSLDGLWAHGGLLSSGV